MIEANENIDLVTARRAADLEASLREGAAARSATLSLGAASADAPAVVTDAVPAFAPPSATHGSVAAEPPVPGTPSLPEAVGRVRLGITAGLVVLLLVVWIVQRRAAARR